MIELPTEAEPVKVICGDAREVLSSVSHTEIGYATFCGVTDPPYGISLESHSTNVCMDGTSRKRRRRQSIENDESTELAEWFAEWCKLHHMHICMFSSLYRPLSGAWRNILVWNKGEAVGGGGDPKKCWKRTAELIYIRDNGDLREGRDGAVLDFPVNTGSDFEFHPCQKPVPLLRYLIRQLTFPGDTVIDPFGGSGTTAVAALHEGRRCIIIEKDATYCDIIRRRVADAMGEGKNSILTAYCNDSLF